MPADAPADAFATLGLDPRFDLSRQDIERKYLSRVALLHPDTVGAGQNSGLLAASLNDARAILLDPEHRAAALLARLGGPAPEKDKSLPPAFLAEMMEVREELDGAARSGDPAQVERWRLWARDRRNALIAEVGAAFSALPAVPGTTALSAIRRTLNAWRYIERMIEQMEERPR